MKTLTVIASLMFSAAAIVVACKENETSTPDGSSSGSTSSGGTSSSGSTGGTSSGNNATTVKSGLVSVTQSITKVVETDYISVTSIASFGETTASGGGSDVTGGCKTSTAGDCTVVECETTTDADRDAGNTPEDAGSSKSPTAGDVKIKGLREITLSPDATTGNYPPKSDTPPAASKIWEGGDDVKISAVGAEVPAFDKTLKAPSSVTVTAPEFPTFPDKLTIPRNADLDVTWANGTAGNVTASFVTTSSSGNTTKLATITCTFKADAGTGKVPSAALGKLIAGDGAVSIGASSNELVDQGGWKINLSLIGAGASGAATFN